ncbi:MAG: branched-chain amino acid ABC transporter permease [Chloroflexi bacterium]|nr:branched-chain amino acid ABC transporter permease [Chloroflexota bacterium]
MEQILIQGALLSGLYALIAMGFTMIFGVGRVLNLAHAGYVMVAGYSYFWATYMMGLPIVAGFAIAIAVSTGLAVGTYLGWVRRFLNDPTIVFVSTFIFALILEHVMTLAFFRENINVPPIVVGMTQVMGCPVSNNLVAAVIASWACIGAVLFFVRKTHMGRAMRALAMDRRGAIISGINPDMVNLTTWAISGALAGVAGVFWGSYTFLVPSLWVLPLIMSFAIVVIGGLGSIEGTLAAAHIVGFMETATVLAINDKLRSVPGLVIMIIVLLARPKGLFGR